MKYSIKINSVKTIEELDGAWTNADFIELLKRFDYEDAGKVNQNELKEYLFMAIADFEPTDAAAIVLEYKLSDVLNEGQIVNLSHEMLREKVSENYSDIYIHKVLFSINQLLYKSYNGKFPNCKANIVEFEMKAEQDDATEITKELVLKALRNSLSDSNLIIRLFKDPLDGNVSFPEAEGIIWDLQSKGNAQYSMTTSEKWLTKTDFENKEYECDVEAFLDNSEEE
ncbi:MAG: hypothetical protein Q8R96_04870 [Bacteroidota bacterium]|nr:hypothetical protein [Bacteroidota bacterium]